MTAIRKGQPTSDKKTKGCPLSFDMQTVHNNTNRIASRQLTRAVTLLFRAGKQLDAASRIAPDRYDADRLRFLATGLRELSLPLSKIASCFEKGQGARE